MKEYKDLVKYWLTFNEINVTSWGAGIIQSLGILPTIDEFIVSSTEKTFEQASLVLNGLHHQLLASAKTVIEGHKINPDFQIGCMIAGIADYPYTCKPEDVWAAWEQEQFMNFYCGDVMVKGEYHVFTKKFLKNMGATLTIEPGDLELLK